MNKLIVAVAVLALAGCTTSARTHAVRGVSGIEVDCSGLGSQWDKCYKCATKECKGGRATKATRLWRGLMRSRERRTAPFGFNPAGFVTRTLLVICR